MIRILTVDDEQLLGFLAVCDVCDVDVVEGVGVVVGAYLAVFCVVGEQVAVHQGIDDAAADFAFRGDLIAKVHAPCSQLLGGGGKAERREEQCQGGESLYH